ncbi:hypothetical protein RJT34_15228 [Clitoria ternatea]|uniref:Uncharacterized protein n=1 Tax=Clitoria ternatea TaxID=43366 RepID=A0AAN9JV37_CLITE
MSTGCEICCDMMIAILIPPLGVCFRHGCCSIEFIICLLLTLLGYIPGIIYALYAIVFVDGDQYFDQHRRPLYAAECFLLFSFSPHMQFVFVMSCIKLVRLE